MVRRVLVIVALGLAGVGGGMLGEPSAWASAYAPSAAEVLKASAEALAGVKEIGYQATQRTEGAYAEGMPTYTGTVTLARAEAGGWKVRVSGEYAGAVAGKSTIEVGYDGATAWAVKHKEKQVSTRSIRGEADLKTFLSNHSAMPLVAWDLVSEKPFDVGGEATLDVEQKVDGVACDVVRVVNAKGAGDGVKAMRYFIARSDHLPRRIERITETVSTDGKETKTTTRALVLSAVKTGAEVPPAAYAMSVPDGYAVRAADAKPRRESEVTGDGKDDAPLGGPKARDKERAGEGDEMMMKKAKRGGKPVLNQPAPDFTLKDADGKGVTLSDLQGNVVVLDFWATWCGPCKLAMPAFQKIHEKYKDKKVKVYGVNVWERGDPVKFKHDKGYTYGLLMRGDDVATQWGITGIPAIYVIDREGKVVHIGSGYSEKLEETLTKVIDKALK